MSLKPYQQRVVEEKRDLDEKLEKLRSYLKTDGCGDLPVEDIILLEEQERWMALYSRTLGMRIDRFEVAR